MGQPASIPQQTRQARILRARATRPRDRMLVAVALYAMGRRWISRRVRRQFPEATEQERTAIIRRRLAGQRRTNAGHGNE